MLTIRNVTLIACLMVLATAPAISAQNLQPSQSELIPGVSPALNLPLMPAGPFLFSAGAERVVPPAALVQDLSGYRGFRFGMAVAAVASVAGMRPTDATVIHTRPALIEELEWRPAFSSGSLSRAEAVQQVVFSFYDGRLFRMLITYDRDRVEGMTEQDMVDGISTMYGPATKPADRMVLLSSGQAYSAEGEKIIARWQDSRHSFNLFRSPYQYTFGMVGFSKRLDPLAQAAIVEAVRLDLQEAPQREIESQKKAADDQANTRRVNKPNFRP